MKTKHWDIKRTHREHWTADDWAIHKFFKGLKVRGYSTEQRAWLFVLNTKKPSKSIILSEVL